MSLDMPKAKRVAPPKVKPVVAAGLKIEAIQFGKSRGLGQNGGYIAASDPDSGKELWTLKVYDVVYEEPLEEDVQDVFIETMKAKGDSVAITDENGNEYVVDVKTKTVRAQ